MGLVLTGEKGNGICFAIGIRIERIKGKAVQMRLHVRSSKI